MHGEPRDQARQAAGFLRAADIVIGVTGRAPRANVLRTVRAASAGLARYYPGLESLILIGGAGSEGLQGPGTRVLRVTARTRREELLLMLELATALSAKATAILDPRTAAVESIDGLLRPILLAGQDLAAPVYREGDCMDMLSATTLYPMMRCLHGWSVRSPAASEMAISGELARHLAASDGWESAAARRAPELWMTSEALARGFAVCDTVMAAARPAADGSLERVAALFSLMTALRESVPAEREGPELFGTPGDLQPSPRGLLACQLSKRFIEARRNLEPVWRSFLRKETVDRLMPPGDRGGALLSDGLWAHILFELAEVFCEHRWFGPPVLETFPILHAARAAAFHSGTCADIEHSCRVFEAVRARLGDNRAKRAPAPCLN